MRGLQSIAAIIFDTAIFLVAVWCLSALVMFFFIGVRTHQLPANSRMEKEFAEVQAALWRHQVFWLPHLLYYNSTKPWKEKRKQLEEQCTHLQMLIDRLERE